MNRMGLMVVGLVSVFTTGCLSREVRFTKKADVHASETDPLCASKTYQFKLDEDQAFKELQNLIGKVTLKRVRARVESVDADQNRATAANGSLTLTSDDGAKVTIGSYKSLSIAAGQFQDVAFDSTAATEMAKRVLNPPHQFDIVAQGCNDANPAFYKLNIDVTLFLETK